MLQAILFDLDDTLLRTRTDAFIARYFARIGDYMSYSAPPKQMQAWIVEATDCMVRRDHPDQTNELVFREEFTRISGIDIDTLWPAFERFYVEVFPTLGGETEPMPGAREAVLQAQALGLKVVVATNPLFPWAAIESRLRWAGLSDLGFDLVTSLENMHSAKPRSGYFREVARVIGVPEAACLAVGNDPTLDIAPAKAAGMWTYLIADGTEIPPASTADLAGDMSALLRLLGERRLPGMSA